MTYTCHKLETFPSVSLLPIDHQVEQVMRCQRKFAVTFADRIWKEQVVGVVNMAVNVITDTTVGINPTSEKIMATIPNDKLFSTLFDVSDVSALA